MRLHVNCIDVLPTSEAAAPHSFNCFSFEFMSLKFIVQLRIIISGWSACVCVVGRGGVQDAHHHTKHLGPTKKSIFSCPSTTTVLTGPVDPLLWLKCTTLDSSETFREHVRFRMTREPLVFRPFEPSVIWPSILWVFFELTLWTTAFHSNAIISISKVCALTKTTSQIWSFAEGVIQFGWKFTRMTQKANTWTEKKSGVFMWNLEVLDRPLLKDQYEMNICAGV